ncbi:MAG: hypothetical protein HY747_00910 [Elusimicrobia bacterium]|nr:hypothetical protein [Elusimicrobiota bacterium]
MKTFLIKAAFWVVFGCIFLSFLFPEYNPDLFWHLAAARKAQELGRLFLSWETFSFSKPSAFWLNYEWLFEWIVWRLYQWGDFRFLVLARASLLTLTIFFADRYLIKLLKPAGLGLQPSGFRLQTFFIRLSNIVLFYAFLTTRATMQPELFTLLFLVLFFHSRDRLMTIIVKNNFNALPLCRSCALPLYFFLFVLWANIHGGFVWAFGILALQGIGESLRLADSWYKNKFYTQSFSPLFPQTLIPLVVLGFFAFTATLINPYGFRLYNAIIIHLKDAPFISEMILEWQPTSLGQASGWTYLGWFTFAIAILMASWISTRRFDFSGALIVAVFGLFAARHVRNIALFGLVSMPVMWGAALPLVANVRLADFRSFIFWKTNIFRTVVLFLIVCAMAHYGFFLAERGYRAGKNIWRMGAIPKTYVLDGKYPEAACRFLERHPELLKKNIMTEWGWGGFAIWRLHDKGARFYFDGRYLFHYALHDILEQAADPEGFSSYLKSKGIDLCVIKHPAQEEFRPVRTVKAGRLGHDKLIRSWTALAFPSSDWAMIWWDHLSIVFIRRDSWPKNLPRAREYQSRINIDPYWVEFMVKTAKIKTGDLFEEIERNLQEAGWNNRNAALYKVVKSWQAGQF